MPHVDLLVAAEKNLKLIYGSANDNPERKVHTEFVIQLATLQAQIDVAHTLRSIANDLAALREKSLTV